MPRGRPDPFGQVPDSGRVHLTPALQILEQDGSQLDEPQGRLAPGDDGVHARTVAVVRAHATVAVAVERGRVAARPTVSLAGDEIDERDFLGLLHGLPSLWCGRGWNGAWTRCAGGSGGPERRVLAQYTGPKPYRQEGNPVELADSRHLMLKPGLRFAADQKVVGERPELVNRGIDATAQIVFDRTGPRR